MLDENRLDELASGYQPASILFAGLRLGVFEALAAQPLAAEELAKRLDADSRGVRILCDALAALELLEKDGEGTYRNAPVTDRVLVPGVPDSKAAMYRHRARQMEKWAGLFDAARHGRPTPEEAIDPRLEGGSRAFAAAMRDVGRESARKVADRLDLAGVGRVLDLGGGPGVYALELASRDADLRAVVFDQPETAVVARENLAAAGLQDRVEARGGDAFEDDLGGPYDLVLVSNFVHIFPPDANRRLVRRCAAVLSPRGRLVIKDFLLDPSRTSPVGGALFAVNMLVSTEAGDGYTVDQVADWMREAALEPLPVESLTPKSRLLTGVKS